MFGQHSDVFRMRLIPLLNGAFASYVKVLKLFKNWAALLFAAVLKGNVCIIDLASNINKISSVTWGWIISDDPCTNLQLELTLKMITDQ